MSNLILISIKEKYVNEILLGKKTIELRKSIPKANSGDIILIYTTKPIMAITAIANVKGVIISTPEEMWRNYKENIGINKKAFDDYYKTASKAVGIELKNVIKLDSRILLSAIKRINPTFSPPQTFKYLNKFTAFRNFKKMQKK